ncbi:hypothetical protein NBRC10513v2_000051 [Rhodotorula toruloides]|uniref:Uncharacterized protein n=1 Tax=Rhodotorula toruloides TaxID=5286 RepID=A0A0K3CAG4_RHOTO|nr:hypothetical protein AAT19DRAFT_12664 [Rhodotorula toruloides]
MDRPSTPKVSSRPSTPHGHRISRPSTPARGSRPGTPSRLQKDPSAAWLKNPPNNLELEDPRSQDRASDLLGSRYTEPVKGPPSEEELKKARDLADMLEKRKRQ